MDAKTRLLTIRILDHMEKAPEDARRLGLCNASGIKHSPAPPDEKKEKSPK